MAAAAALTFGLALAGCSNGEGKKYDHLVTFDYNAGDSIGVTLPCQYLGVKDESLVLAPSSTNNDFKLQTITGYAVEGWFLPQEDENGKPVKDENGRVVCGKEWNFKTDKVTSDLTLYANLSRKSRLLIKGATLKDDGSVEEFESLTYTPEILGTPGTTVDKSGDDAQMAEYSLVGYYTDKTFTQEFSWPYTFGEEDLTIYARFLEGTNWRVVNTAEEFKSAIANRTDIFVKSDIDFSGTDWSRNANYPGTILGNGHKISNITCEWNGNKDVSTYGLFGAIGSRCHISDFSFENVNITFRAVVPHDPQPGYYKISACEVSVSEEAVFENFSFSGTLKIERTAATAMSTILPYAICETPPAAIVPMFQVAISGDLG
ncbi:MAG: hypothetical protein K2H43_05215, partial [Clostridia bacterium]|nr:hypothetical protein [Clostridia bacterium]